MSRVGKKPILIPKGVEVKIEGQKVVVRGPKGELSQEVLPEIKVEVKDNQILVSPAGKTSKSQRDQDLKQVHLPILSLPHKRRGLADKQTKAFRGLTRALIANMVKGVTDGYEKKLEIMGIGFRAKLEGNHLVLEIGFTHPVKIICPAGINFSVEKNIITVSGIDKQLVGEVAAKIRNAKKPEPYKGKGIKYINEVIRRKAGKKVVGTGA